MALALTLNNLGMAHLERHELDTASDHFRQALALFAATSDEHGTVNARANLAWVTHYLGDHQSALAGMAAAHEFYVRAGCARNTAICLRGMALAEVELGNAEDALRHAEQALDGAIEDLDKAMSLNCLGWVLYRAGRANQASAYYRRAVEAGERCGSHYEYARALTGLGNVAAITGDPETATRRWNEAAEAHALAPAMAGEARVRAALA